MPTITTSGPRKPATMNIILLRENDWTSGQSVCLSDYRAQHIISVIQPALGQSLRVGLINGHKGIGTVTAIDRATVQLEVALTEVTPSAPPDAAGASPTAPEDAQTNTAHSGRVWR